jgi:hypothetical protein
MPAHGDGMLTNGNLRMLIQILGLAALAGGAYYQLRDLKGAFSEIARESKQTAMELRVLSAKIDEKIAQSERDHVRYDRHIEDARATGGRR